MVRYLQPLDVVPWLLFNGKANQARAWRDLGREEGILSSLGLFLREMLPGKGERHSLVWARRGRLGAMVSARYRSSPLAWEVDRLFLAPGREDALLELLDGLSSSAVAHRVHKIFLRLPLDSPLVDLARRSGFCCYRKEALYRLRGGAQPHPLPQPLRPRTPQDEPPLFQLYNMAIPAAVRAVEGITLEEWSQAREPPARRELVYPGDTGLVGWVCLEERGPVARLHLTVHPSRLGDLGPVVDHCLGLLGHKAAILTLVPEFQPCLTQALEERGGQRVAEYAVLVKQLTARVRQPQAMPMRA